jgi:aspartyl-tRNA synthetase
MIMAGEESIKEVIPFPKNNVAANPMDGSPSSVAEDQLKELHIKLDLPREEDEQGKE